MHERTKGQLKSPADRDWYASEPDTRRLPRFATCDRKFIIFFILRLCLTLALQIINAVVEGQKWRTTRTFAARALDSDCEAIEPKQPKSSLAVHRAKRSRTSRKPRLKKPKLDTSDKSDDQDENFVTGSSESESSSMSCEVEVVSNPEVCHQHFDKSIYLIEGRRLASVFPLKTTLHRAGTKI